MELFKCDRCGEISESDETSVHLPSGWGSATSSQLDRYAHLCRDCLVEYDSVMDEFMDSGETTVEL